MEVTFYLRSICCRFCHAALLTDDDLPGLLNRLTRIHRRQTDAGCTMPASAVWR